MRLWRFNCRILNAVNVDSLRFLCVVISSAAPFVSCCDRLRNWAAAPANQFAAILIADAAPLMWRFNCLSCGLCRVNSFAAAVLIWQPVLTVSSFIYWTCCCCCAPNNFTRDVGPLCAARPCLFALIPSKFVLYTRKVTKTKELTTCVVSISSISLPIAMNHLSPLFVAVIWERYRKNSAKNASLFN